MVDKRAARAHAAQQGLSREFKGPFRRNSSPSPGSVGRYNLSQPTQGILGCHWLASRVIISMARYVPAADFVPPSEEVWGDEEDDYGGAPTEISVAPQKGGGGGEVQSGRGVAGQPLAAGGYTADELAALADDGE